MMTRTAGRRRPSLASKTNPDSGQSLFAGYGPLSGALDEVFTGMGAPRPETQWVVELLEQMGRVEFRARKRLAELLFQGLGVTFAVYADGQGSERIFPFDPIPRTISATDWSVVERGLIQRITALNSFLTDLYGPQRILEARRIPRAVVEGSRGYLRALRGVRPPAGVYIHVAGIDLIRGPDGALTVLEDNLRTPSGVSYVLENRQVMKKAFPQIFQRGAVRAVDEYPLKLRQALDAVSPRDVVDPSIVVLTPGQFNSAYFEHCFLARRMGVPLVQGSDLFVENDQVFMRTTHGPSRVHVIYRRIDDAFLDPEVFRADSLLGVRGLVRAYAAGNVALANAIGNGVADDKAIYPYVPEMIRFYLAEEPILPQVETYLCEDDSHRSHVLANLPSLVVKAVDEAGGYGMLMGPKATRRELSDFADRIRSDPRRYIAQPLVELSTCPTMVGRNVLPRRVDFRPYIVTGRQPWVLPGGLTRVALREGSYVVNSSQGGGSKDTWVLAPEPA
jgi:uncharacterized circularly permuted ATP-grasp superfamily protein